MAEDTLKIVKEDIKKAEENLKIAEDFIKRLKRAGEDTVELERNFSKTQARLKRFKAAFEV